MEPAKTNARRQRTAPVARGTGAGHSSKMCLVPSRSSRRSNSLSLAVARQEVVDIVGAYCERIDSYDIDGVVALFSEDCVADYGPSATGPIEGRDALRTRLLDTQAAFRRTHHQLGQVRVHVNGDRATSMAYTTATHQRWDGTWSTAYLQYHDQLARRGGVWQIVHRRLLVAAVQGASEEGRHWVPRRLPDHPQSLARE